MHALKTFLASLLRGGRDPRHLLLAVVLGFTAGAVGGWNLTFAAIICLAALLNCPTTLLVGSAACGFLASHFGASATRSLGVLLLDKFGLGAQIAKLGDGTFVALFRLDDYSTFGSLAAGIALSIPAAQVYSRFATHRRSLLNLTVAGISNTRAPLVRPLGFAAATCCAMLAAALVQVQGSRLVGHSLLEHLSAALQTEVTADVVAYDLWSGDLQLTNLRVADAERPTDVALVVEQVSARVEPGLMLRGRFDCREMTVAGLFCDPTKLSQAAPVGMFAKGPTLLKEDHPQPSHNEDPLRPVEIQSLVRNWSGVGDRLLVVQRLVTFVERIADLETAATTSPAFKACVDRRRALRDAVSGSPIPLVQVGHIKIDRLPSSWKLSPESGLSLSDLSSCPALASRPAQFTFKDNERGVVLTTTFHLDSAERKHDVTLAAKDIALESLISNAATRSALEPLADGTTSVEAHGWITRELLHLDLTTKLQGLQVAKSSSALAGIDAAVWRQGLERLGSLDLEAEVAGRFSNPKLTIVPGEIVRLFKTNLQSAGAKELVVAFEKNKPTGTAATVAATAATAPPATTPTPTSPTPTAKPEAKPLVPPVSTAMLPKPAVQSGSASTPGSVAGVPPTMPHTIQPMAMTHSAFMPTGIAPSKAPTTIAVNSAAPPVVAPATTTNGSVETTTLDAVKSHTNALLANAKSPAFTPMNLTAQSPTATPAAPTSAVPTTTAPTTTATAAATPTPQKTMPTETLNPVTGLPWKEPSVVLGTPAPTSTAAATPASPSTTAAATPAAAVAATTRSPFTSAVPANQSAIGLASDAAPTKKSVDAPASALFPQEIAAETSPALGAPGSTATEKPKKPGPAPVAQIPTSIEATAGLRQPLSVLDPSTAPGPINMTVGYDGDRAPTTTTTSTAPTSTPASNAATAPKSTKRPTPNFASEFEEAPVNSLNERVATQPASRPNLPSPVNEPAEERRAPREQFAAKSATKPVKPPVADKFAPESRTADARNRVAGNGSARATNERYIEDSVAEPIVEPAPKKKSLFGNVTGWFGAKAKPAPSEAEELETRQPTAEADSRESSKPAPKKMFPRIRAMFGETPEMLPPDEADLSLDREVVPSVAEETDATANVRTSGFDAALQERDQAEPATAELGTETPKRSVLSSSRPLNLPRLNIADQTDAKPLAEASDYRSKSTPETANVGKPKARKSSSDSNVDPSEPTAARTPARSAERMSAGESFYNRTVR